MSRCDAHVFAGLQINVWTHHIL